MDSQADPPVRFADLSTGAPLIAKPTGRILIYYPVFKLELETITMLNTGATVCWALMSASTACCVGFAWDLAITGPMTAASATAATTLLLLAILFTLVFTILAWLLTRMRRGKVQEIMESTKEFEMQFAERSL